MLNVHSMWAHEYKILEFILILLIKIDSRKDCSKLRQRNEAWKSGYKDASVPHPTQLLQLCQIMSYL